MWANGAKQHFSSARVAVTLVVTFLLLLVGAGCGGAGPSGSVDGPGNADDQATATSTSSTSTSTTTTTPSLGLPDLAERLSGEIASGECSTVEELEEDFSEDVLVAAVVDLWTTAAPSARTVCEELSKLDAWLSDNDRRVRATSNAPVGCDRTAGEVDLGAFPALSEAVDRSEVACLSIGVNGDELAYSIRGAFDEMLPLPAYIPHPTAYSSDGSRKLSGLDCSVRSEILTIGDVYFGFADLLNCPKKQGFGPSSLGAPIPIAALVSCDRECTGSRGTWFASDGFFWDRGGRQLSTIGANNLAELDFALSGLDAGLFAYGTFDGPIRDAELVSLMSMLEGQDGNLSSDVHPTYQATSMRDFTARWLDPTEVQGLAAYRGTNAVEGSFPDCADWDFDQIVRGGGQQPCIKATMKIFQFDQATGYCSFLAEMPDDGADQWKHRWDELVFVDGSTPNVEGACLVDAEVDNDDYVVGHFVSSGTVTYENQLGVATTVPKLTALRVIEAKDR